MVSVDQILKSNSHVHANGYATDQDVLHLARKYGVDLSPPPEKRDYLKTIRPDGSRNWATGIVSNSHAAYDETVSLIRNAEDLYRVVKGGLLRDARDNCIYTRLLSSALNNCRKDSELIDTFERNMLAIIKAIRDARAESSLEAFVSVSAKRNLNDGVQRAHRLLDAAEHFQKKHPDASSFITGFDMAGDERPGDLKQFREVFDRASRPRPKGGLGLPCSCHASEVFDEDNQAANVINVAEALNLPGIRQLSHILGAATNRDVREEIDHRNILVDQLLISNGMLHSKHVGKHDHELAPLSLHPFALFADDLTIALGSDDPGLQGTTIGGEYVLADKILRSQSDLLSFTANAIRFGFVPASVKTETLKQIHTFAKDNGIPMRRTAFHVGCNDGQLMKLDI